MILTDEQIDLAVKKFPYFPNCLREIAKAQLKAVAEWLINNKTKDDFDYVTIIIDKKEWAELLKEAL
jgi:hypothetical protein